MTTFAEDIEIVAGSEAIEAIVIGEKGWGEWDDETNGYKHPPFSGKVLSWAEARPHLDYKYDRGYGSPGCHAVAAYTATHIIFVSQYDSARRTRIESVPRNPIDHMPEMPGGG